MVSLEELIKKSLPATTPSEKADDKTELEKNYLSLLRTEDLRQKELQTANQRLELEHKKSEHDQRVRYAKKIFILISCWLVIILLMVIAAGSDCKYFYLHLSDKVLITLLTTTTVTVLGLFVTVINYIFARKN